MQLLIYLGLLLPIIVFVDFKNYSLDFTQNCTPMVIIIIIIIIASIQILHRRRNLFQPIIFQITLDLRKNLEFGNFLSGSFAGFGRGRMLFHFFPIIGQLIGSWGLMDVPGADEVATVGGGGEQWGESTSKYSSSNHKYKSPKQFLLIAYLETSELKGSKST